MPGALQELDLERWVMQLTTMTPRMVVISSMQIRSSSESTSSRHDLNIVAGQSHSTKTLESPPVETVVEHSIQLGATTSSGNPVLRQRSIDRSVSEKEVTGLPQL
jgi:hypothetical protein